MHTIEIPDINLKREMPSGWDEMTSDDMIRFTHLYLKLQKGIISLTELKTEMVYQFLGLRIRKWRLELMKEPERLQVYQNVFLISEKLDFFFTEEKIDGKINLKVNFPWTKNLIPVYNGFIGPDHLMADISFIEYKNAHVAAADFIGSNDVNDLNWFVANLYRKPLIKFMKKPAYNEFRVKKISEKIAEWPYQVKYAILLNFLAWEEYIRKGTYHIDGNDISFSLLFDGGDKTESGSPDIGLTGLLYNLAETGVFGNVKSTSEQNLYDVLIRLYQVTRNAMEMEKKLKKKPKS